VAPRITIPISFIISTLIFGLTKYYTLSTIVTGIQDPNSARRDNPVDDIKSGEEKKKSVRISTSLFIIIFTALILICIFTPKQNFHIFVNWSEIGIPGIIQLSAAIMLCFFVPGYGIVLIITRKCKMNPILAVLLAYLLSMLITGLPAYIAALFFDSAISESKNLFILVYVCILVTFLIFNSAYKIRALTNVQIKYRSYPHFASTMLTKFWKYLTSRGSELLVFGSLFTLLIVSTYYLYGGITIGDQWHHQGRALLFMSGSFREAAMSNADNSYPPFQSALLAAFTTLSGLPLVNSYASIAFLNMTPVFAFSYFFSAWVPRTMQKAGLLACSLFTLSAGFGWIYLFTVSVTTQPIVSEQLSLDTLASIRPLDIIRTSNFVIPTSPDFSTGLIYIVLPIGFVLLGIVHTRFNSNFINTSIVAAVSILGIMTNDEYYIFIIIASLLPLIFKLKARNYLYLGFLLAFSSVFIIDIITPGKFFTLIQILGVPLLLLNVFFVVITWTIYLTRKYIYKILMERLNFLKVLRKLRYRDDSKIKFLTVALVISVVAYAYLLCFIVLSQLPLDTITVQSFDRKLPWYLYPMRMGLVGLLGLAFVVSYIFKRFEKQIFVFGILITISLLAGPYYDEHRFSKYIMIGAIGFASLMLYKILTPRFTYKPAYTGVLISVVIISSSLSILIFIGTNSLILQTQDFGKIFPRRHFPSISELHLFEALHDKIDPDLKKYNVVSIPKEYNYWESGLMSKIQGFAGLPKDKLYQSPLTLNASTLDALYRHLDRTDAQYIILPKDSIQVGSRVTEPTRFAIDHFKRIYEDYDYTVLDVPPLEPATSNSKTEVALLYNQKSDLEATKVSDIRLLPYNNETFDFKGKEESVTLRQDNQTERVIQLASKNDDGDTLWSKNIVPATKVNYIEVPFRITSENEKKSNNVNLKWLENDTEYSASLSGKRLELYHKSIDSKDRKILVRNTEVGKNDWMWDVLKIVSLDNSINIYINDVLKIQASRLQTDDKTEGISRVGLESNYNDVEFGSIKIGKVNDSAQKIYEETKYYDYYYPLSLLALSKTRYDIFSDDDLSAFSSDAILTSDNLKFDNVTLNQYLEYVRAGGKLIVINSDNNFSQPFSQLFSIQSNDTQEQTFTNIAWDKGDQNVLLNVPGIVKRMEIQSSPDLNLIATYRNANNQTVAPFLIEKLFSNGGKIVLINAGGYFNTLSKSPQQYFLSLSNISKLLDFHSAELTSYQNISKPVAGFIGNMTVSGMVTLNSSSLSILDEASNPYDISASRIAIFNNTNDLHSVFDDVLIKDLKLIGDYETKIKFTGILELPDMRSNHDYFGMLIPSDFNMTVNISPAKHSYTEIVIQNHSNNYTLIVNNDSKIEFYGVRAESPLKFVPVLMKNPELEVNGNASIKKSVFQGYIATRGDLESGAPLDLQGKLRAKFDFIDHYIEPYRNGTRISYITYLQSITMEGNIDQYKEPLRLPGDISAEAKEEGKGIPLEKVLNSSSNILILIASATITLGILLLRRIHGYQQ